MIPRFSLYGIMEEWHHNIREDPQGRWVRWKDIAGYLDFCQAHGFSIVSPVSEKQVQDEDLDSVVTSSPSPPLSDETDEVEDAYDYMTKRFRADEPKMSID